MYGPNCEPQNRTKRLSELSHRTLKFILAAIPTYLRDILSLPVKLLSTIKLYNSLAKTRLAEEKLSELLQSSDRIIYLERGNKNRYFLIQEPQ
jgi:hypothetical protein